MCKGKYQGSCARPCAPAEQAFIGFEPSLKEMRTRTDDGPIKGAAVAQRMTGICGCEGRFDCNCVTVENQARRELWTEHNQALLGRRHGPGRP